MVALLKAGYINQDIFNQPQLIQFQRAARTDKGVSALRQTLSLKLRKILFSNNSFKMQRTTVKLIIQSPDI